MTKATSSNPAKRHTAATYIDPGINIHRGNPFIAALPPSQSKKEALRDLRRRLIGTDEERALPAHLRLHLVENLSRAFIPMDVHWYIEQRISSLLRNGYISRNPILDGQYWNASGRQGELMSDMPTGSNVDFETTGSGFMILGGSGNGKTTAVQRVLRRYPQVIEHTEYNGKPCAYSQIVWLRLEAPENSSLQELVLTFFEEIDVLLGSNYFKSHGGNGRYSLRQMIPTIPAVINAHAIGMIIFDELQNLKPNRSGGHLTILNFLMKLINVTRVPIVTIGTFGAAKILCSQFRLLRRITSGGGLIWERMSYGPLWQLFVEQLMGYQYLKLVTPYSNRLAAVLYDETQGITAYAVSVFQEAQRLAIDAGKDEVITEKLLRSAGQRQTEMVRTVIKALKDNKPQLVPVMEDVFMLDLERFIGSPMAFTEGAIPTGLPIAARPSTQSKELLEDLGVPPAAVGDSTDTTAEPAAEPAKSRTADNAEGQSVPTVDTLERQGAIESTEADKALLACITKNLEKKISPVEIAESKGFLREVATYLPV